MLSLHLMIHPCVSSFGSDSFFKDSFIYIRERDHASGGRNRGRRGKLKQIPSLVQNPTQG